MRCRLLRSMIPASVSLSCGFAVQMRLNRLRSFLGGDSCGCKQHKTVVSLIQCSLHLVTLATCHLCFVVLLNADFLFLIALTSTVLVVSEVRKLMPKLVRKHSALSSPDKKPAYYRVEDYVWPPWKTIPSPCHEILSPTEWRQQILCTNWFSVFLVVCTVSPLLFFF